MKKSAVTCSVIFVLLAPVLARAYPIGSPPPAPAVTTGTVSGYLNQAQQLMSSTSTLPVPPSWFSLALQGITQWFGSIASQGAEWTGAPFAPAGTSGPLGSATSVTENLFAKFDAWLYGIIRFHVASILDFILGFIIWVLGIAKNAVDSLNAIFKSATGR